ncbi:MAG TPA: hypothetical protein VLQ67_05895 [Arachnia sp.]|nr:hypothetical protein [Arachnia sp.]
MIIVAVAHQIVGWFVFRTQLVYRLFSRIFGAADLLVWGVIFFPFLDHVRLWQQPCSSTPTSGGTCTALRDLTST